jgi:hypothetical protein
MNDTCTSQPCGNPPDPACSNRRCADCCDRECGGECVRAVKQDLEPSDVPNF